MDKKKMRLLLIIILIASVLVIALSYALFSYSSNRDENHTIRTGTLILNLDEVNNLTLSNNAPTSDSSAMETSAYQFTVKNTGTEVAKYKISLIDDTDKYISDGCENKKMPWSKLRYSIMKNNDVNNIANLGDKEGVLTISTIASGASDTYDLRVWIDQAAGNEVANLHFHAKLKIDAILENRTDFETGA